MLSCDPYFSTILYFVLRKAYLALLRTHSLLFLTSNIELPFLTFL